MVKAIKTLRNTLMTVILFLLAALVYGFYAVPDEIVTQSSKPTNVSYIYTLTYEDNLSLSRNKEEKQRDTYNVNVSFLNIVPVKNSSLKVSERDYVAISGELFGIRLFTEGIIVVGVDEVQTAKGKVNPSKDAGLQKGDVIVSIDSQKMRSCSQVSEIIENSGGKAMKLQIRRKNKVFFTDFKAAYSESEGKYKAGIWIRDSAAGIGTMTFLDAESGMFASLGHGVCPKSCAQNRR